MKNINLTKIRKMFEKLNFDLWQENSLKIEPPVYQRGITFYNKLLSINKQTDIYLKDDKIHISLILDNNAYARHVGIDYTYESCGEQYNWDLTIICRLGRIYTDIASCSNSETQYYIPIFIVYDTDDEHKELKKFIDIDPGKIITKFSNKFLMDDSSNNISSLWIFPNFGSKLISYDMFNILMLNETIHSLIYEKLIKPYLNHIHFDDNDFKQYFYRGADTVYKYIDPKYKYLDNFSKINLEDNKIEDYVHKTEQSNKKNIHNGGKIMKSLGNMGEILKMSLMTKMMSQPDGEMDFGKLILLKMFDDEDSENGESFKFSNIVKTKLITQIMNGKEKIDDLPIDKLLLVQMLEDGDLDMEKLMMMKFVPSLIKSILGDDISSKTIDKPTKIKKTVEKEAINKEE